MNYLVFLSICILVNISPGPAVFLAIKNGSDHGLQRAAVGISGNLSAMIILALMSAAGLGSILMSSPSLYAGIKIIGGFYLVYFGVKACLATTGCHQVMPVKQVGKRTKMFAIFRESFCIGISNPKAIAFYTSLFPQFIDPDADLWQQFALLTAICGICSSSFLFFYAATSARLSLYIQRESIKAWINRIVGVVFIGFGFVLISRS